MILFSFSLSRIVISGKAWPVAFGAGLGLGIGYANCQHDLQSPYAVRGKKVLVSIDVLGHFKFNVPTFDKKILIT